MSHPHHDNLKDMGWSCACGVGASTGIRSAFLVSIVTQAILPELSVKKIRAKFPETISKESNNIPMKNKLVRFLLAAVFAVPAIALAQAGNTDSALPAAPSAANTGNAATEPSGAVATKIGTINIEQAIFASNEGQRDFEALSKKLEPKQTELKNQNDEVESLKKQLNTQSDKMTEEARNNLVKQIEQKQKALERAVQDARDDAQSQQNEIAQRILQKMAPVIVKYAGDKGFGAILDTSNPWPQGPVLWAAPAVDITKAVVDAYNIQSGVPAPVRPATKPSASGATSKPAAPAASKPAAPAPSKPQTSTEAPK
jgi:outer membrane protein